MSEHAIKKLSKRVEAAKSRVILGLDFNDEFVQAGKAAGFESPGQFSVYLINAFYEHISGIKLNISFAMDKYLGDAGFVFDFVDGEYPDLPTILDGKPGDVGDTQLYRARADKNHYHADFYTINSHMGPMATINPYLETDPKCGVFVVAASSNGDAWSQNRYSEGVHNYEWTLLDTHRTYRNKEKDETIDTSRVGFVVGSTKPDAARNIRSLEETHGFAPAWFLMPGFGKQGGSLESVAYAGPNAVYPLSNGLVNPAYLKGLTPLQAVIKWKNLINEASKYESMPMEKRVVKGLLDNDLFWVSAMENKEDWRKLHALNPDGSPNFSPMYYEVRHIQQDFGLMQNASYLIARTIRDAGLNPGAIGMVPYGALGLGYSVASHLELPSIVFRAEAKDGKLDYIGKPPSGANVVPVEDVATSGDSTIKIIEMLRKAGYSVTDAVALIDREGKAKETLAATGVRLHSPIKQSQALEYFDQLCPNHPGLRIANKYLDERRQKGW